MDSKQPKGRIFLSTLSAAFFILWGGLLIVNPAMAATITVCSSGCNATTIQDGIDMASSGDTVLVSAGTYDENLAMKSGVDVKSKGDNSTSTYMIVGGHTITAMNRAMNTVIHGDGETSVVRFPSTITTDVSLDGFIIENFTKSNTFLIRIDGGSPTIKNNIIHNNTGSGHSGGIGTESLVAEPADPLIENNLIHNVSGPGIGNGQNSNATIRNNVIWDCKDSKGPGIGLWGYAYPKIENNIIFESDQCAGIGSGFHHGTVKGLTAGGGNNTLTIPTIKGNIIHGNYKAGIHLERASGDTGTINVTIGTNSTSDGNNTIYGNDIGIRLNNLTSATIENNNIHDQTVRGIRLVGLTSATIHNNKINNQHMAGIRLESINNVTISNNDIHHSTSTSGIYFEVDVVQAIVENNQIHENKQAGIRNGHTFAGNIGADTLIVRNNNIYSNTKGGISIEHSGSTNTIQGNTIHDNVWGGIFIERASAVTVEDNQIYSNGYGGIYDEGSDFLSVNGTDIYDNHYGGIQINYGTGDGNITHNTIHQNYRGGIGIRNLNKFEISQNQIYNNLRGGIHTGQNLVDGTGFLGTPGDANVTIKKNKVYGNGQTGYGGGIDVRHADGVIYNNLVYENYRAGIRFGDWIDEIVNNTVVKNGTNATRPGGGIVYDDLAGDVNAEPGGYATNDIPIKNNICTNNVKAGIRVNVDPFGDCPAGRDYNLLCQNNGITDITCPPPPPYNCEFMQLYLCPRNDNEIFADPLFVSPGFPTYDYTLQLLSPARTEGDLAYGAQMGAYGGSDPMTW